MVKPYYWKDDFIAALREVPVIVHACKAVGINRVTAYRARDADPEFARDWDAALEDGIDRAEQEAYRRAVLGVEEPVYQGGQLVGTRQVYSDSLLSLVLKGRRKKVYADRTELTGADGGPVKQAQVVIATGVPSDDPRLEDLA